jgi:acetolactate synthase-1/2/3 large subunit
VIVDIDPAEIRKLTTNVDVPAAVDAAEFLRAWLRRRDRLVPRDRAAWLARAKGWQARYPLVLPEYWQEQGHVNNYVLVETLSQEMSPDDLLVPGSSGACSEITMQSFRPKKGMRVFNTEGLGPMGFGVPAALGGCLASGGRRTVCIDGDGGFPMNNQELETIRRLKLPIKFFVLCNDGYASIRNSQRNYFASRFVASDTASGLSLPDTRKVAEAYGIATATIEDHSHIRQRVREVLDAPGPSVCTVRVSRDQMTAPRLSSSARPDGTIVSKPLEDLFPFLDREEFRENMIVPPVAE